MKSSFNVETCGKGKALPVTYNAGTEREYRYSSTLKHMVI